MRSQHIRMTVEEYHLLPALPGWKCEYFDGKAHLTPRHQIAFASVPIAPCPVVTEPRLRNVTPEDASALSVPFFAAFEESCEYCDWTPERIRKAGEECIARCFNGKRGRPMEASRVAIAVEPAGTTEIIGAALIIQSKYGPYLDLLFVHPHYQRDGLATAMVASALNALHSAGECSLLSAYDVANTASMAWHQKFGFVEEPDLLLARLRLRYYRQEVRRFQSVEATEAEQRTIRRRLKDAEAWVKHLEEREKREGFEAVTPILRFSGL